MIILACSQMFFSILIYFFNISKLNKYYAELTGEYWAWKNSNVDIIGFCHYRRYFVKNIFLKKLNEEDIETLLQDYDIILPQKRHLDKTNLEEIDEGHVGKTWKSKASRLKDIVDKYKCLQHAHLVRYSLT